MQKYTAAAALRRAVQQTIQALSGDAAFPLGSVTVEDSDGPPPAAVKAHAGIFPDGEQNLADSNLWRKDEIRFKVVVLVTGALAPRSKKGYVEGDDPNFGIAQRCEAIIRAVGEYPGNIAVMLLANTFMDPTLEGAFQIAPMFHTKQLHPSTWNSQYSFFGRENYGFAYKKAPGELASDPATGRRDVLSFRGAVRMRSFLP